MHPCRTPFNHRAKMAANASTRRVSRSHPILSLSALCLVCVSLQAAPPDWRLESLALTNGGPLVSLQLAYTPGRVLKHPVILLLGSLQTNELPEWSTNLVREGYLLAAFSVAHPPDPDPKRRAQWLYFDERFAHSYVLGGMRAPGDAARVIDHLVTRADVDADRIGWMGSSTTGIFGLAVATHEPRLKAIVAFVATGAYEQWLNTWKPNGLWRGGTNGLWPESLEALPKADPTRSVSNLFPCAVLMVSGGNDKVVDPASAQTFVEAARPFYQSDPERLRLVVYEGMGHNLPRDVVQLYTEHWFRLYLHPTNPAPPSAKTARSLEESARQTSVTATAHDKLVTAAPSMSDGLPWKINPPIATVKEEVYKKHPRPGAAALVSVRYVGPKLERLETHAVEFRDDVHNERFTRLSLDNGRTWQPDHPLASTDVYYSGKELWEGGGAEEFDSASGLLVGTWLRQIAVKGIYNCFTYVRLSHDLGRTWTEPKQLRYEPGPDFNPKDPHGAAFLAPNQAYFGNNILRHSNGTLIHGVAHANAPGDPRNAQRPWKMGSLCFIGRWNAETRDYDWRAGQQVEISPDLSARGLMEPEVTELRDGRVLVVWRGSNTGWDGSRAKIPGRKFYSISRDGGFTLSLPAEWKYDDGSSFYSPSSIHRMLRHSVTGKLYWMGNICAEPPEGNSPRYPLVLAEVDEEKATLKKSTVTAIDDRRADQPANLQLSNFSLVENRETHEFEIYLTLYGENSDNIYAADCYKYTVRLKDN